MNTKLTPEQKWEQATLANNFIFYKVMRDNPDDCKHLLEILLEIEIDHIEMQNEEQIVVDYECKGIRLDVYAKNATQAFDLEIQAIDTKELPERARYYQSAMDIDALKSGALYKDLKDSYVIFICLDDIFNMGLPLYIFKNLCIQDPSIPLNDRSYKYFFIAKNCDKILNREQQAFLKLLTENQGSDDFSNHLARCTAEAKQNFNYKRQFMEWERQLAYSYHDGKEEGFNEGAQQKAIEAAERLLKMNLGTIEQIAEAVNLPLEEIQKIKDQITVKA